MCVYVCTCVRGIMRESERERERERVPSCVWSRSKSAVDINIIDRLYQAMLFIAVLLLFSSVFAMCLCIMYAGYMYVCVCMCVYVCV